MTGPPPATSELPPRAAVNSARNALAGAAIVGAAISVVLMWLLARVVWLPAYFGVFFFLVAGMLVGALAFRVARAARPVAAGRVAAVVAAITVLAAIAGLGWEFRYRAATIGEPPRFNDARADARQHGREAGTVTSAATAAFRAALRSAYPPGGMIGYARWAFRSGQMRLELPGGFSDDVELGQRRWAWLIRTIAAYGLFAVGLWYQLEALRSSLPTCNILQPGEEAEDA